MSSKRTVLVYGAYGHTGRFVIAELCRRGWTPILSGRDVAQLVALGQIYPALEQLQATVEDPASLAQALAGAAAVINCAGPFLDTAIPLIEAALHARIHYLDVSAEQQTTLDVHTRFDEAARLAEVTVMPAIGFYGGLADLLATAAMDDWPDAEAIDVAVALDSWFPTSGTRRTGARNKARRLIVANGQLTFLEDPAPTRQWRFASPFGLLEVVGLPLSEIIMISRHLRCIHLQSYMNLAPLKDLRNPDTPAPVPADADGRSAQQFLVEVEVRRAGQLRVASAQGRDIYAITAPLVVEALQRIVDADPAGSGALVPGAAFDARDFLAALTALRIEYREV